MPRLGRWCQPLAYHFRAKRGPTPWKTADQALLIPVSVQPGYGQPLRLFVHQPGITVRRDRARCQNVTSALPGLAT